MFLDIPDLLTPAEVAELIEIAGKASFIDGRTSNPHAQEKDSLLLRDPQHSPRAAQILAQGLMRSAPFNDFAFPRVFATPILSIYSEGGRYGRHSDSAFMALGDGRKMRSDLSCTIFLDPPDSYDGGELVSHLGTQQISIKGQPGSAIVYASTTIHEVRPVTRGRRLVGLTFIESRLRDPVHRDMMYELNEIAALEGFNMSWENRSRLQRVRDVLLRAWT